VTVCLTLMFNLIQKRFSFSKTQKIKNKKVAYQNTTDTLTTQPRKIYIKRGSYTHRMVIQDIQNYSKYCEQLDAQIIFYDKYEPLVTSRKEWSMSKPSIFLMEYKRLEQLGVGYSSNSAGDGPIYMLYTHVYESERALLCLCKEKQEKINKNQKIQNIKMQVQSEPRIFLESFFKEHDDILIYIESGMLFLNDITSRKFSAQNATLCTLRLARMVSNDSLCKKLYEQAYLKELLQEFENSMNVESIEDFFSDAKDYLNAYDMLTNSKIFKKIYKVCMYILSFSIFDKYGLSFDNLGYSKFEAELIRKKFYKKSDFGRILLESILYLIESGLHIIKTGRVDCIIHSQKAYTEWFDLSDKLKRQSNLLQNPEAHDFNEFTFRAELDSAIEKGEAIYSVANDLESLEKRYIRTILNDLKMIRCEITTKQAARESRTPPYSILISGDSGIGKSTIKDLLFKHFAKVKKLDRDDHFCYTRNPAAKFWDGFTTSMWCVILDDVAFMHPNKATSGDPSVMEFLQIINAVPFVPDQADLGDKGRTPLKSKLCIATTNTEDLNAHFYFSHASAAQRRFPYIVTPVVKSEYTNDSGMLDSSLTGPLNGSYPNWWVWTVKKVIPTSIASRKKKADIQVIHTFTEINDFISWYSKSILEFDNNQTKVSQSVQEINEIEICDMCFLPKVDCKCEIQSYGWNTSWSTFFGIFALSWVCNYYLVMFYLQVLVFIYQITGFQSILHLITIIEAFVQINWAKRYCLRMRQRVIDTARYIQAEITPKKLMYSAMVISCILTTYQVWRELFRPKVQSKSEDIGEKPKGKEKERENVWYKNDYQFSAYDFTSHVTSSKSLTEDQFYKRVASDTVHLRIYTGHKQGVDGVAFCLQGHTYITNNHNFADRLDSYTVDVTFQSRKDGVTQNLTVQIDSSSLIRNEKTDTCVFTMRNLPIKQGLIHFIPKNHVDIKLNGYLVHRDRNGSVCKNVMTTIRNYTRNDVLPGYEHPLYKGLCAVATRVGHCGSPLIVNSELGYAVVGLHFLGDDSGAVAASIALSQDMLPRFNEIGCGEPKLSSQSAQRSLTTLHPKSVFRYIDEGSASVYGSFAGFRPTHKSNVSITPMAHFLSPLGYKIKCGPPVMQGWQPWRIAAVDMVKPITNFSDKILGECKEAFLNDILSSLPKEQLDMLHVYDNFTAVNGANGVAYVDKINRNTSAGNPWKKSKKFFMEAIPPEHNMDHPVVVDKEIMDRVDDIITTYEEGKRAYPNFCAHLKDEPVSFKKIKMGKTRVFTGAPFDWTIVVRKYLLSSIRIIQNNRFVFEAAPGTVAQSVEWSELYNYIVTHGTERIIAGDYKAFDKRMSPSFILAAFDILHDLCKASGNYSDKDLLVIRCIAEDTAFPFVDFNGDLVQFYGSNPSGHPLTVIINSLVNSLYMRYVYYVLNPEKEVNTFKQNVSLMTYGDDNIMSVSNEIDWYNHTAIARAFLDMEITYTMADKEAESIPFIHIDQASFLKRSWIYDEEVGSHLAPLEHDSIEKMLMTWVRSKQISIEEQALAVISTAAREYFFYGRKTFEEKVFMLRNLMSQLDIEDWILPTTFPTFDTLKNEFWSNSERVKSVV